VNRPSSTFFVECFFNFEFKDVRANCSCASLLRGSSLRDVMPRHALSARAIEENVKIYSASGHFLKYLCTGLTLLTKEETKLS